MNNKVNINDGIIISTSIYTALFNYYLWKFIRLINFVRLTVELETAFKFQIEVPIFFTYVYGTEIDLFFCLTNQALNVTCNSTLIYKNSSR
jgi:hypothetical protein